MYVLWFKGTMEGGSVFSITLPDLRTAQAVWEALYANEFIPVSVRPS